MGPSFPFILKPVRPDTSIPSTGPLPSSPPLSRSYPLLPLVWFPPKPSLWSLIACTPSVASLVVWKDTSYHVTPQLKTRQCLYLVLKDRIRNPKGSLWTGLPLLDHLGPFTTSLHRLVIGSNRANTKSILFNILNSDTNSAWCVVIIQQMFFKLIQIECWFFLPVSFQTVWSFLASTSLSMRQLVASQSFLGRIKGERVCKAQLVPPRSTKCWINYYYANILILVLPPTTLMTLDKFPKLFKPHILICRVR